MYLIFYDISNNKLRTKVAKTLIERGYERLQYSVYVGSFYPEHFGMWEKLKKLLSNTPQEQLYYLKLSEENFRNLKIIGNFEQDMDYLCGQKSSLIF